MAGASLQEQLISRCVREIAHMVSRNLRRGQEGFWTVRIPLFPEIWGIFRPFLSTFLSAESSLSHPRVVCFSAEADLVAMFETQQLSKCLFQRLNSTDLFSTIDFSPGKSFIVKMGPKAMKISFWVVIKRKID